MPSHQVSPTPSLEDVNALLERARQIARLALDPPLSPVACDSLSRELETIKVSLQDVDGVQLFSALRSPESASVTLELIPEVVGHSNEPVSRGMAPEPEPPVRTSTQEAPLDHAGQETRRTASGRSWKRLVLLAFVLLLVGFVAGYLWMIGNAALRAQRTAMSASERLAELREARSADPEASFADPLSALQNTCQEAGDLERDLRPISDLASAAGPASDMIGQVPGVGARASAMLTLAGAARESSAAVRITCDVVSPLVHGAPGGGSTEALVSALLTEL
ncbi:MAG: hypothetical protein ACKVVP_21120, partial [Chloroflexota bacterium]